MISPAYFLFNVCFITNATLNARGSANVPQKIVDFKQIDEKFRKSVTELIETWLLPTQCFGVTLLFFAIQTTLLATKSWFGRPAFFRHYAGAGD